MLAAGDLVEAEFVDVETMAFLKRYVATPRMLPGLAVAEINKRCNGP